MVAMEPAEIVMRLIVAVMAAVATSWCWLISRLVTQQPIFPDRTTGERRAVPWHFGTILLVFLAYIGVSYLVSKAYPLIAGRLQLSSALAVSVDRALATEASPKAPDPPRAAGRKELALVPVPAAPVSGDRPTASVSAAPAAKTDKPTDGRGPADPVEREKQIPWSHLMFLNGLVMVILLVLVPCVVCLTSRARWADFGLRFGDWWRQAVHGVIATLIAAPPVYAIQFAAAQIWKPLEHPLSKMIAREFSVGVGWLAVVTAVVLAPMFEELVFRGILQSWLVGLIDRGWRLPAGWSFDGGSASGAHSVSEPVAHVDDATAGDAIGSGRPTVADSAAGAGRDWGSMGIVLTSLLFAFVHADQWPAPIALFALAMVIGTVYDRTGSLISAICMHATFNGISTLMLFAMVLVGPKLEAEKVKGRPSAEVRATRTLEHQWPILAIARGGRDKNQNQTVFSRRMRIGLLDLRWCRAK
jgi:membrane protease YdiL (CAAX protease family)